MNRVLWFVLGGIVTAVGFGIAAVMRNDASDNDSPGDTANNEEDSAPQDDTASEEQSA